MVQGIGEFLSVSDAQIVSCEGSGCEAASTHPRIRSLAARAAADAQYSSGKSRQVEDRSASVMHQSLSPALVTYAEKTRSPFPIAASFAAQSALQTVPKSPQ